MSSAIILLSYLSIPSQSVDIRYVRLTFLPSNITCECLSFSLNSININSNCFWQWRKCYLLEYIQSKYSIHSNLLTWWLMFCQLSLIYQTSSSTSYSLAQSPSSSVHMTSSRSSSSNPIGGTNR